MSRSDGKCQCPKKREKLFLRISANCPLITIPERKSIIWRMSLGERVAKSWTNHPKLRGKVALIENSVSTLNIHDVKSYLLSWIFEISRLLSKIVGSNWESFKPQSSYVHNVFIMPDLISLWKYLIVFQLDNNRCQQSQSLSWSKVYVLNLNKTIDTFITNACSRQ